MTQPTTIPAPAQTPWSYADYQGAIQSKLAEEYEDVAAGLEKLAEISRLDFTDGDGNPAPWKAGTSPPGSEDLIIHSFFEAVMPGGVLAYVFPKTAADARQKIWRRYTLSLAGAVTQLEIMNRETFVSEIAEELGALLDPETCSRCGKPVTEDDSDEEGEEDDEPEDGGAAPTSPLS